MFTKKDYLLYFEQLYNIEMEMIKEAQDLKKIIKDENAIKLIDVILEDEKKHAQIVKDLSKLIK